VKSAENLARSKKKIDSSLNFERKGRMKRVFSFVESFLFCIEDLGFILQDQ
jgi:hypothetical protein